MFEDILPRLFREKGVPVLEVIKNLHCILSQKNPFLWKPSIMMQEEDCLDFSPSPDNMAGVDVSFADSDCNGPTLLMAASSSKLVAPESSEDGRNGLIDKRDVEEVTNSSKVTEEVVNGSSKWKENEEDSYGTTPTDKTNGGSKIENDDASRVKELFGHADDGESFGEIGKNTTALSTASVLFANEDTSQGSDLFPRDERADSFSNLIGSNVNECLNRQENHRQSEKNTISPLNHSFQNLGIGGGKTGDLPSPAVSPQSTLYPQNNMTELSQLNQGTLFTTPQVSNMSVPMGVNSLEPSLNMPGSLQHGGQNQPYLGLHDQIPMYYSPTNEQQKQGIDNNSIEQHSFQDKVRAQNGANVGNSYMYTAPIASIMPGYESSQSNQMPHKQTGTRLHQSHVPKQPAMPAGELFVPDLYGHSIAQPSNQVNIFTPSSDVAFVPQSVPQNVPQVGFGEQNMPSANYNAQNQYTAPTISPYNIQDYQQYGSEPNFYHGNSQDPGFWEWVKNQDWSEGAQKLGKQLLQKTKCTIKWVGSTVIDHATKAHLSKTATDTVLTTLDPGMEEYLSPSIHLAIASQDNKVLQAVRHGFKNTFGHTAAKGHFAPHSLPKLPIGFELGTKAVAEQLDAISTIDFEFSQPYIHVALQPFLTELQRGSWYCMFCIAARDCSRRIQLQAYSQPISIPSACISIAYSRTSQGTVNWGFDVSIDELVRLFKPFAGDEDWCSTLNGIKLDTIISVAAQGLASDYKRELENSSLTQNDSFVVLPS